MPYEVRTFLPLARAVTRPTSELTLPYPESLGHDSSNAWHCVTIYSNIYACRILRDPSIHDLDDYYVTAGWLSYLANPFLPNF